MIENTFEDIDPILDNWLPKYGLSVYKEHKGYSVRSIDVVDDNGISYLIWIEKNNDESSYTVKAHWDSGKKINRKHVKKSWDETSVIKDLFETLDKAYGEVHKWIIENGNTRNWKNR